MSIASEITRISGNIEDAYTAALAKGATMPAVQNSDNLATTIGTIPGGTTAEPYIEYSVSGGTLVSTTSRIVDFTGVTVADRGFARAYDGNTVISGAVDLKDVITIALPYCFDRTFRRCTGVTSFVASKLKTVVDNYSCREMFFGCSSLTSHDLSSLTSINGDYAFSRTFTSTGLTGNIVLPATSITGSHACEHMYNSCANITSMTVSASTLTGSSCLNYLLLACTSLENVYFPNLNSSSFGTRTNQFDGMLSGVTGCTVHFPSNVQSVIGSWASVTDGFGGTNTTVLFDLQNTEQGE